MNPRERIRTHYEDRIDPRREGWDVLDWASARTQKRRFEILLENVDLHGRSILDVGCGVGELLGFLQDKGVAAEYTGVDILEKMVEEARRRHPGGRFLCADIFESPCPLEQTYDVVYCSGTLNLNVGNNDAFLPRALRRFVEVTRQLVVVNFLHIREAVDTPLYYFYDPRTVLEIAGKLPVEARLIDDYLPNDFTVVLTRESAG